MSTWADRLHAIGMSDEGGRIAAGHFSSLAIAVGRRPADACVVGAGRIEASAATTDYAGSITCSRGGEGFSRGGMFPGVRPW